MASFKKNKCLWLVSVREAIFITGQFTVWKLIEQSSNLAPQVCPTGHFFLRHFDFVLPDKYLQKIRELELAFVDWTFAKQLVLCDILR